MGTIDIDDIWIYQQPSGCVEIGQKHQEDATDLIHICSSESLQKVIDALITMRDKRKE